MHVNSVDTVANFNEHTSTDRTLTTCTDNTLYSVLTPLKCIYMNLDSQSGTYHQGTKKVIFTACHLGKLKLAFSSPNVILTSPQVS